MGETVTEWPHQQVLNRNFVRCTKGEGLSAIRANRWGMGQIRKLLKDFPKVGAMVLRSELTGRGVEKPFEGVGTVSSKAL